MSTTQTTSLARLQELLPQLFETPQVEGEPYLRCQLTPEMSGLVSMEFIQESLLVPGEQITFIPNMPSFVMGLMTSRDRVFFVIDFPHLMGLSSPCPLLQTYQMIVLRISPLMSQPTNPDQELFLGLVVPRIQGVIRVMSQEKEAFPRDFSKNLLPFIQGTVNVGDNALPIFNLVAIMEQVQGL
ncbi:MAG: chemotaxis protein CheW [Crocosphaera sp.]